MLPPDFASQQPERLPAISRGVKRIVAQKSDEGGSYTPRTGHKTSPTLAGSQNLCHTNLVKKLELANIIPHSEFRTPNSALRIYTLLTYTTFFTHVMCPGNIK